MVEVLDRSVVAPSDTGSFDGASAALRLPALAQDDNSFLIAENQPASSCSAPRNRARMARITQCMSSTMTATKIAASVPAA